MVTHAFNGNWEQCLTVADQSDRYEGTLHQLLEKSGPTNGATNQHFPRWPSGLLLLSLTAYLQSHCRAHRWGKCRIRSLSGGSVWTEGRSRCSRLSGRGGEPRGCGTEELSREPRQYGVRGGISLPEELFYLGKKVYGLTGGTRLQEGKITWAKRSLAAASFNGPRSLM